MTKYKSSSEIWLSVYCYFFIQVQSSKTMLHGFFETKNVPVFDMHHLVRFFHYKLKSNKYIEMFTAWELRARSAYYFLIVLILPIFICFCLNIMLNPWIVSWDLPKQGLHASFIFLQIQLYSCNLAKESREFQCTQLFNIELLRIMHVIYS